MLDRLRRTLTATMTGLLIVGPIGALAQEQQYPDRPIKIIVPFTAGGAADTLARIVADKLQAKWNKPVVVENRPGATGNLGAEAVVKAEPDGYTLLVAPSPPFAINQHLFANLRFDPAALVPITVIAATPNVLVARSGLPASSVRELIALARSQPGKLTYGSAGKGSTFHLSAEMLKSLAGIEIVHVPYKGVGFLNDLVGGNIDLAFVTLIDGHPLIESGRIKALGVGAATRSPLLSDVPTLAETIPGFLSSAWFAIAAPPKTPPQIAEKLSFAIAKALSEPDSMVRLQSLKATPILNSPAEAAAFIAEDRERWRKVIVAAGVTQE